MSAAATPPPIPDGVTQLGPGLAVRAEEPLTPAQRGRLSNVVDAVAGWLRREGLASSLPGLLVDLDWRHPLIPRAHLYPDGRAHCIALGHADLKVDLIAHEVTHALSGVRDGWASELLAYPVGFRGAGALPTEHMATLAAYDISVSDIVREGFELSRLLTALPDGRPPGLTYEPTDPCAGFLFLLLFDRLRSGGGTNALPRYLKEIDQAGDGQGKEALFTRLFGLPREALLARLVDDLAGVASGQRESAGTADSALLERLARALRSVQRRWWTDVFDLLYLRTAIAVHRPRSMGDPDVALLYLDYRIYRAQRTSGRANAPLLRWLLRRSAALATSQPASTLALSVRYFLLTDHALDQFAGHMSTLSRRDPDLATLIVSLVSRIGDSPCDPLVAALTRGHFHLFYPRELGADADRGRLLLDEVLASDPAWEEAHLHLAAQHARRGDGAGLERCLREYRRNTQADIGPRLLASLLNNKGERHESDSSERF